MSEFRERAPKYPNSVRIAENPNYIITKKIFDPPERVSPDPPDPPERVSSDPSDPIERVSLDPFDPTFFL